ncbi:MAG TPA: aminodeoxychorismate/anthranilate synthase component II [Planctomycetaceae bacterium]|nr:aminodeoxychorismate/anthranilate synthase component II [Planctomycetaceae bacterium]
MIVLIDNYDSFLHNLARYFRRLGEEVCVRRNDADDLMHVVEKSGAVVISPGPCDPDAAGSCLQVVREFANTKPMLGVCLGHQVICQAFGGKIVRAGQPMHGRSSQVDLDSSRLFAGISTPQLFARYHSLVCAQDSLPDILRVTARSTIDDEIMAVEHTELPIFGVQFHPESVLSQSGYQLLANFLSAAKLGDSTKEAACSDLPESDLTAEANREFFERKSCSHYDANRRPPDPAVFLPRGNAGR